jgi:hypothetical protein
MNETKLKLAKLVLQTLELPNDDISAKKAVSQWWANNRKKENSGFKLTDIGFLAFKKANIKYYSIPFDQPILMTNQLHIWLDHFIDCPFYVTSTDITVFSEKMAVQLLLFSGNIYKYGFAKASSY